jgi:hypothetical protein
MSRLIRRRRETPELGWGSSTLLENEPRALFAHRCDWQGSTVVAVHNLGAERVAADLALGDDAIGVDDLLEDRSHRVHGGRLRVELDGYGYLWLRARREGDRALP